MHEVSLTVGTSVVVADNFILEDDLEFSSLLFIDVWPLHLLTYDIKIGLQLKSQTISLP